MSVMQQCVAEGKLAAFDPLAAWEIITKGLMAEQPSRMLVALRDCGALAVFLPEVDALFGTFQAANEDNLVDIGEHQWRVLDQTARCQAALPVRFAALLFNLGKADSPPQHLPTHYPVDRLPRLTHCQPRLLNTRFARLVAAELGTAQRRFHYRLA
ncbi:MAG: hypothetical protein IPJ38_16990 [Dechloromonas sp.]|uniref:Uncharacterized protein n=1 Tax=Candidatus Dechloromonas phosphorivorans TaxID=2899244 RepID=A0A935JZ68_9RHOO|nr:hypothetical protein [Candidatus Dechloromonas phosphorivorans]